MTTHTATEYAPAFKPNGETIFNLRYPRKDEHGALAERPGEAVWRVGINVAAPNALYEPVNSRIRPEGTAHAEVISDQFPVVTARRAYDWLAKDGRWNDDETFDVVMYSGWPAVERQARKYARMLADLDFLPNSPTWTGAGTPLGQLAACFVLPVDDDLGRGPDSIYATLRNAVLIQQTGGGNGFSFGRLRPAGWIVKRSMGKASGPMGFANTYNGAFKEMAQGGSRRGANMLVMPIFHPDIESFIEAKTTEGVLDQFNFSVGITDEFMVAVDKDLDFDLHFNGEVAKTIRARDLWDKITQAAWVIGDPGNLFLDRANAQNPCPARYVLEATNPCGEQWLPPYANCCLGSISLGHFVKERSGYNGDGEWYSGSFDWDRFAETCKLATEFLDDVVDANQYVPDVPQLEEAAMGERRIGLGLMGLADAMALIGIRYGSPEGREFAAQVTEFARYWSMYASTERAAQRGPFEWFKGSIYDFDQNCNAEMEIDGLDGKGHKFWSRPEPMDEYVNDFGRPPVDWSVIYERIRSRGIRNACQFTFAPTGTISNVAGQNGSGCEPFFALAFTRKVMQEGENIELAYFNETFEEALIESEFWSDLNMEREKWLTAVLAEVAVSGSCQESDLVPDEVKRVFVVAADVTPEEHVLTQSALQAFVDNSISKTINLPKSATVEDVARIYKLAFDTGSKGITVYRQGSRDLEVLSVAGPVDDAEVQIVQDAWPEISPMKIPSYASTEGLDARVFPVETFYGKLQVTITHLDDRRDRPFDVRLQLGKAGNDKNADVEALGRVISIALRSGVSVDAIVEQLEGIGGSSSFGFGERKVRSVADGIAKLLKRLYMVEALSLEEKFPGIVQTTVEAPGASSGEICPNCLQATVIMESGCRHCDVRLGGCGEYSGCD